MLTKELAPLFRDDEKEQRQNFARLTSVLDGNGYMTSSGTHGTRGYAGSYLFNWLGATTPVPDRTFRVMAQLGNRILFYEIASDEWTEDDLMEFAQNYGTTDAVSDCQRAVNLFIDAQFRAHPVGSVDPHGIDIPEGVMRELVRYGKLIAHGRVEVSSVEYGGVQEAEAPEGPQRVILLLQSIIRGLALAEGRMNVTIYDLILIRHIAFSSIPRKRRELLRALLVAQGSITSSDADKALGVSRYTAISRMKELAAAHIVVFTPGDQQISMPDQIALADDWRWLLEDTPLSKTGVCAQSHPILHLSPPIKESGV